MCRVNLDKIRLRRASGFDSAARRQEPAVACGSCGAPGAGYYSVEIVLHLHFVGGSNLNPDPIPGPIPNRTPCPKPIPNHSPGPTFNPRSGLSPSPSPSSQIAR